MCEEKNLDFFRKIMENSLENQPAPRHTSNNFKCDFCDLMLHNKDQKDRHIFNFHTGIVSLLKFSIEFQIK